MNKFTSANEREPPVALSNILLPYENNKIEPQIKDNKINITPKTLGKPIFISI